MPRTRLQTKKEFSLPEDQNHPEPDEQTLLSDSDEEEDVDLDSSSDYYPSDTEECVSKPAQVPVVDLPTIQPCKSVKPPPPPPPKPPPPPALGEEMVNKRIRVLFEFGWLTGRITKYDKETRIHNITFDVFTHFKLDGSPTAFNLQDIKFEIIEHDTKETCTDGRELFSETTTTTHWTKDTTTRTVVKRERCGGYS